MRFPLIPAALLMTITLSALAFADGPRTPIPPSNLDAESELEGPPAGAPPVAPGPVPQELQGRVIRRESIRKSIRRSEEYAFAAPGYGLPERLPPAGLECALLPVAPGVFEVITEDPYNGDVISVVPPTVVGPGFINLKIMINRVKRFAPNVCVNLPMFPLPYPPGVDPRFDDRPIARPYPGPHGPGEIDIDGRRLAPRADPRLDQPGYGGYGVDPRMHGGYGVDPRLQGGGYRGGYAPALPQQRIPNGPYATTPGSGRR